jgi:NOL1/NOP2/fmu family ribosome biogenesis protein
MSLRLMSSSEKKKLITYLHEHYGISPDNIDYTFIESGKDKIRAFSGTLTRDDLAELGDVLRVEGVGLYCLRKENYGVRFGFDATQIFGHEIKDHVIELSDEEFKIWMSGNVVPGVQEKGIYVVKYRGDCLGCAFHDGIKLLNYVPRERQMRH